MRVSGFSMVRDAVRLNYPVAESIRSILPICDEFVIAVGQGEDGTVERIRAIGDPKVRILETEWNPAHFVHGAINAVQSNLALDQCTGDWAFYVQADEVVHEDDLPLIVRAMERAPGRSAGRGPALSTTCTSGVTSTTTTGRATGTATRCGWCATSPGCAPGRARRGSAWTGASPG